MAAVASLVSSPDPREIDHFVHLRDVGWRQYEALLAMRGDHSLPRITYLEGVLEIMSPSRRHESDKKRFARLLEVWADEAGVDLEGVGSWTLKDEHERGGVEPDECYAVGWLPDKETDRPDIAIEVVWTKGGVDKLEVYRKLGVREVWFYERGALRFFGLRGGETYGENARSEILPGFDPALFVRCMAVPSQTEAIRALRAALREARPGG